MSTSFRDNLHRSPGPGRRVGGESVTHWMDSVQLSWHTGARCRVLPKAGAMLEKSQDSATKTMSASQIIELKSGWEFCEVKPQGPLEPIKPTGVSVFNYPVTPGARSVVRLLFDRMIGSQILKSHDRLPVPLLVPISLLPMHRSWGWRKRRMWNGSESKCRPSCPSP